MQDSQLGSCLLYTSLFEIPARVKIGRAKSVPVETYPTEYAQIEEEMDKEIKDLYGGELL